VVLTTFVVLHLESGVVDLVYVAVTDVDRTTIGDSVLRFTMVAVFLAVWRVSRLHQTYGTSR
jgi:hypothetical protein